MGIFCAVVVRKFLKSIQTSFLFLTSTTSSSKLRGETVFWVEPSLEKRALWQGQTKPFSLAWTEQPACGHFVLSAKMSPFFFLLR